MVLENPLSQIVVGLCFLLLIIVLFFDEQDYLTFSVLFLMISTIITTFDLDNPPMLDDYVGAVDWEVIFFLISMFTIAEILNEAHIFHEIAKLIVKKYRTNIRFMFYLICVVSTLSASIIEDLSVAIIFIPIIILTCQELKINPAPFLYGMTICINLASTLTPFGSAENVMIANEFNLTLGFFISNIGAYFIIATSLTLFLLDITVLKKSLGKNYQLECTEPDNAQRPLMKLQDAEDGEVVTLEEISVNRRVLIKNLIGLIGFIAMLVFIHAIHVAGLLGMLLFVFLNAEKHPNGIYHPKLSQYLRRVDYKLVYFFICLFILVYCMEINGTITQLEFLIERMNLSNIFLLSIFIVIFTSILSGFLDNAPVTIIFMPILSILIENGGFAKTPLIIAFILGINLGGNFLPQGSAPDMMTLELSTKYCVKDVTYKKLTKLGGLFALFHVILGIIYLAFLIYVFPTF